MTRRSLRKPKHSHEEPLINLTPLIDVVFVILIMFIVVAPLLNVDHVELAEGPSSNEHAMAVQEQSVIAIHVRQNNEILFNQRKVNVDELVGLLKQAKQEFPKQMPQLFHDKNAYFGTYQSVKNAIEEAGFSQMDVILTR